MLCRNTEKYDNLEKHQHGQWDETKQKEKTPELLLSLSKQKTQTKAQLGQKRPQQLTSWNTGVKYENHTSHYTPSNAEQIYLRFLNFYINMLQSSITYLYEL